MAGFFDVMKQPPVQIDEEYPLFNRISIETTSFCNRSCSFCPISKGTREDRKYMDDAVFKKVVDELSGLGFDGVVQMFFLNEPLLDRRFLDMAQYVRDNVSGASIYISTNGDALGKDLDKAREKLAAVFNAGVTVVNLNVYDGGEEGAARRKLYDDLLSSMADWGVQLTEHKYRHHNPRRAFISITDMRPERLTAAQTDMFYDRTSEDKEEVAGMPRHCMRTQRHMVVEFDGRVPICCAIDPTDQSPRVPRVGSVVDRTIRDIWDDEVFFKYRYFTQQARRELPACRGCNHKMAYPHVVRKVTAPEDVIAGWEAEARRGLSLTVLS